MSGAVVVGSFMVDTHTIAPTVRPVKVLVITNRSQHTPSLLTVYMPVGARHRVPRRPTLRLLIEITFTVTLILRFLAQ